MRKEANDGSMRHVNDGRDILRQGTRAMKSFWLALIVCLAFVCWTSVAWAQQPKAMASSPGQTSIGQANLPAGVYEVAFRMRIDRKENTITPLATLAVNVPGYPNVIYKPITPINFDAANAAQEFTFQFDNFKAQDVQAAVTLSQNKVAVPKLIVEKISIAPSRSACLGTVWPGKVIYYTGEDAKGFVVVYNGAHVPQQVHLRCVLESDLSETRPLKDEPLTLAAGERREVPLTWNTCNEEYGFALAAALFDSSGKELSRSKEYFSVADNLWKVGITQLNRGLFQVSAAYGNSAGPIKQVKELEAQLAAELAKPFAPVYWNYGNYGEFYAWSPDDFFVLAPEADYWYSGTGNYTIGKRYMRMATEWLHRHGMRAIAYCNPFSCGYGGEKVCQRHPDWFVYDKNGQLALRAYYQKKLEVGSTISNAESPSNLQLSFYASMFPVNIANPETIDAFVDQVVKSHKMFGWDGIRMDNGAYSATGYDFYGNKIDSDPKTKSELEVRAWKRMRDGIWQKLGRTFAVGDNDDYEAYYSNYPAVWDESCRQGQLLMEEISRSSWSPQSPHNRWHDYMKYYRQTGNIVRALGGHHLTIGLDIQYPVDHLYLNVLTYAMGSHPYAQAYHSDELPLGNYAQFITRYSALIWDVERVKPLSEPDKKLTVKSAAPVWWKELACVRQTSKGNRQYIVHLVNPPVQDRIYTDETNKVPPVLSNIQVNVRPEKGEKISRAWLLSADPVTHAEALPIVAKDGRVSVTVPRLDFWSVVVFE